MFDHLFQTARIAARTLARERTFSVLAATVLALGICGVTTQFSIVHAFLLRGLPVAEPERLVSVKFRDPAEPAARTQFPSYADYVDWNRQQTTLEGLAAYYTRGSFIVVRNGSAERVDGGHVTESFFSLLRVSPLLGRDFTAADNRPEAERVTILSHAMWQNDFGGDANILGRSFRLNGRMATVVGVLPADFTFTRDRLWIPLFNEYQVGTRRGAGNLSVFGRLKPGRSIDEAEAGMTGIVQRIARDFPASNARLTQASVEPLLNRFVDAETRGLLIVMLAAVAAVLAIACVNVTNLQFARSIARRRELAVRGALGASRSDLIVQIVIECVLLVAIGGVAGVLASGWATTLVQNLVQAAGTSGVIQPPPWLEFRVDRPVLTVTLAAAAVSVLIAGLLPALSASRTNPIEALRDGARGQTSRFTGRLMGSLVVGQIALTFTLLVISLLLVRSIVNRETQPLGYDGDAVMIARMNLETEYRSSDDARVFYSQLLAALRAAPGVTDVALTSRRNVADVNQAEFEIEGRPASRPGEQPRGALEIVSDGYFAALGLHPRTGREFASDAGRGDRAEVMLVNETLARLYFPGTDPIGRRLRLNAKMPWTTIVGVVPDTLMQGPVDAGAFSGAGLFLPISAYPRSYVTVVARGHAPALQLFDALRRATASVNPNIALYSATTPQRTFDDALLAGRMIAGMFALFAVVAVVLATLGLYGVISLAVNQRLHEFGIRMALGAQASEIARMVLRRGALQLGLGLVIGGAVTLALIQMGGSLLEFFLFRVGSHDPVVFGGVVSVLAVATIVACVWPARAAARVDPMIALRAESAPRP